jgi:leucyl/phenylalanyl-tRNA--protein transferase
MKIPWLDAKSSFPDVSRALTEEDGAPGLLAAGADLSPPRLLQAYRHGVFPWFSEGQPILWWSTDPRMVLMTDRLRISASLGKKLKQVEKSRHAGGPWQVTFDQAFDEVIAACANLRRHGTGTWISGDIIAGYSALHRMGYAHSVECWFGGQLAGGAYGICIGRMFYGESMFAKVTDASKIALSYLVAFLRHNGVAMIDCQQETAHLASLGACAVSRNDFMAHLRIAIAQPAIKIWKPVDLVQIASK